MTKKFVNFFLAFSCSLLLSTSMTIARADENSFFTKRYGSSSNSSSSSSTVRYTRRFNRSSGRRDGATLHILIIADTKDERIGGSVKIDANKLDGFVQDVEKNTGLSLKGGMLTGDAFTKSNILGAINELQIGPDDVVWFHNSSHGFNPGTTKWPAIHTDDGGIPINEIADILRAKNPRLSVVIADVCNAPGTDNRGGFMRARIEGKPQNYQELFMKYEGEILASGSIKGQYSWGNPQNGGAFTNAFLRELETELLVSGRRPSWKALMERSTQLILVPQQSGPPIEQQPQAEVNVKPIGTWEPVDCTRTPDHSECVPPTPGCVPELDPKCPVGQNSQQRSRFTKQY